METLLSGIAIAAIGALAWLAWHEHGTFSRLHRWLQNALIAVIAYSFGHNVAILQILYKPEKLEGVSGSVLAKMITDALITPKVFAVALALMAYFLFLWLSPFIRERPGDGSEQEVEPEDPSPES